MSIDTFNAVTEGYAERLFDLQLLQVHSGYWAAYFTNSKHPQKLDTVLQKLINQKNNNEHKSRQKHVDDVDVEAFLAQERAFKEKLELQNR